MSDATEQPETHSAKRARILGELSELGLTLARDLHARALAAETPAEAEGLALAFQRVSRSVRQTFALELKIERERRLADREDAARAEDAAIARHRRHKDAVRAGVERLIWTETEDEDEAQDLVEELEHHLGEAAVTEGFEDTPVEALIARIQSDMGLGRDRSAEPDVQGPDAPEPQSPPFAPPLLSDAWATGCADPPNSS
ncbi:MAG TPA: hypothetical protein VNW53_07490 [Phenylobacterium sp.]|jgi:hypothetical protein|uniref:hypothetical protein n=1 Tax=Phenylobacterium sp. TaxID=1871053 RepID=UPI002BA1DC29|nr:hypothetical protein [Phenylobacterium sp.]HXA38824.1 hypothetical protein [Phenylobacterium sp.]